MEPSIKMSGVSDLLTSVRGKMTDLVQSPGQVFIRSAPASGGTSSSSSALPSWLMPLVVVVALGFAAVKFLPKVFKKGRGSRSVTKR